MTQGFINSQNITLPLAVNQGGTGVTTSTGTGSVVLNNSPTLVTPTLGAASATSVKLTGIGLLDGNGATLLSVNSVASAVNYIVISDNITGSRPYFQAAGSDSNIVLSLSGKGTGGVEIQGTSTNDSANTGYVGQYVESVVLASAPVSFTTGTSKDLTSISLSAGDWDVYANIGFTATTVTLIQAWINTSSNTAPDSAYQVYCAPLATSTRLNLVVPTRRLSLSGTTTVYLSGAAAASGTLTGYGVIWARRAR